MTPQQSHRRAEIMFKHGHDGWRIYSKLLGVRNAWVETSDPCWRWDLWEYCAVRIEKTIVRTPLPIEHYRTGMLVRVGVEPGQCGVVFCVFNKTVEWVTTTGSHISSRFGDITHWRWPNETEWHPAYTETVEEREVERLERLEVEG